MTLVEKPPSLSAVSTLISHSGAKSASETLALAILHNLQYQHNWTDLRLHLVCLSFSPLSASSSSGLIDLDGPSFTTNANANSSGSGRSSSSSSSTLTPDEDESKAASPQPSTPPTPGQTVHLISGLPPRHSYIHPDLQNHLVKRGIQETDLTIQREFVLPLTLGEKWTLGKFCAVFDILPDREMITVQAGMTRGGGNPTTTPVNGSGGGGGGRSNSVVTGSSQPAAYEHKDQKRVLLGMRAREGGGGDGTVVYYIMQEGAVKPRQNG